MDLERLLELAGVPLMEAQKVKENAPLNEVSYDDPVVKSIKSAIYTIATEAANELAAEAADNEKVLEAILDLLESNDIGNWFNDALEDRLS